MANPAPRQYVESVPHEIQDLLYDGRKIAAIKLARARMKWDLRQAKENVEAAEAEMRARFPGALPERKAVGCGAGVLVLVVLLALAALGLVGVLA